MKILYISKGDHVDYQDDCLCIGLKELFGTDVVDINKRHHIYDSYDVHAAKSLYGMGMTVTRVLPDLHVDRTDIGAKIKNRFFDLIVYGSIWRCSTDIQRVLQYYPKNRVIAVDGEDETNLHPLATVGMPYFKRELIYSLPTVFPISFAFPTSKQNQKISKSREFAVCDPRDRSTYIYKNEHDYYMGYAESKFAFTMKKAGWDCLRHYEILGNNCIPIFLDINNCPKYTMTSFPKQLAAAVVEDYQKNQHVDYEKYYEPFQQHFENNMTTKSLAINFLQTINNAAN